jgi:hypothetical protein
MTCRGRRNESTFQTGLESLTTSLGEQYDEYKKISERLSVLSTNSEAGKLEKPILYSIERAVVPSYKARERRDRQARVLLIIVLILLVIPSGFSPNSLIDDEFIITFAPGVVPRALVFWISLVASLF